MHARTAMLIFAILPLALAGCIDDNDADESSSDDRNSRHFNVNVPAGATQVHVDVTGDATRGEPDVTVLIEDERGNNLATDTFSVGDRTTRRVSVDVSGQDRLAVTVRVVDGDAELDVRVSATVPNAVEPVVIVQERVVIVQVVQATPPTATTSAPAPTTTPATTPVASPTPTVSPTPTTTTPPATNGTNTTNATNTTP